MMRHGRRHVRRSSPRFVGLGLLSLIAAVAGTLALGAGAAFAYWVAMSHPSAAAATAGTLPTPAGIADAATSSSLGISWADPGNPKPQYFTVLRCNSTHRCTPDEPVGSGGCKGPIDALACTDSGLSPDTTYTYAIRATYYSWTSTSAAFQGTTTAGDAMKLAFKSAPVSGPASAAANLGPVTIQLQDAFGNPVHAGPDGLTVHLTSNSTGPHEFSATRHGNHTTTVTIAPGSQTATFYYGDEKAGWPAITATATGVTPATRQLTIMAASQSKLAITSAAVSGPASATANLGPVTIQLQDAFGNPVHAGPDGLTVHLMSNSTGLHEFSATRNGNHTTTVTIAPGSQAATFYYGDEKAGSPAVTATATGLTPVTQRETITAGAFASDAGNSSTGPCDPADDTCTTTSTSITTDPGHPELIFVYVAGSGSGSGTAISAITGPFASPSQYADTEFQQTSAGASRDNYLFAWTAAGNGRSGSVAVTFNSISSAAKVWVDVIELGAGDSVVACASDCSDSGTGGPADVLLSSAAGSEREIAFLGAAGNTTFGAPNSGATFALLAPTGGTPPYGTYDADQAEPAAPFSMAAAGAGWGSIGVAVTR
jgi:hypothetical protein